MRRVNRVLALNDSLPELPTLEEWQAEMMVMVDDAYNAVRADRVHY